MVFISTAFKLQHNGKRYPLLEIDYSAVDPDLLLTFIRA